MFRNLTLGILVLALWAFAVPAAAQCAGATQIRLGDGSAACVLQVRTAEMTRTRSVEGAGPATARKRTSLGGVVVLQMLKEPSAKATTRNAIHKRARAVCLQYKEQLLEQIKRPKNPFMVVVFRWGKTPQPSASANRLSPSYRELFMHTNCRVQLEK